MKKCQICGKKSKIQKSGVHQYGGAWARRATKKRRVWMVNLHTAKVTYNPKIGLRSSSLDKLGTAGLKGVRRTMRLCTKCLRRVKAASPARHPELVYPVRVSGSKEFLKKEVSETLKLKEPTPIVTA